MRRLRFFAPVACVLVVAACMPARASEEPPYVVTPAVKATCVVLRAVTTSGVVDEICATAEELAPFVAELIAERAEADGGAPPEVRPELAFKLPASPRRVPRRRCVQWAPIVSTTDAGDGGDGRGQ